MNFTRGPISLTERISPDEAIYDLLVIDDDPRAVQLVTDVLRHGRFTTLGATSAAEGLDKVAQLRPRVVLLDLVMPGVHGMELLDQILHIAPSIDVILVTGCYSTDSAVEAIQKGRNILDLPR